MITESQLISTVNKKIQNAKGKLGGDSALRDIANESLRDLQVSVDFPSAKRHSAPFRLYSNVFEYPLPVDCAYSKVCELLKESEEYSSIKTEFQKTPKKYLFSLNNPCVYERNRESDDLIDSVYFDVSKVAIEMVDGVPILKVLYNNQTSSEIINDCSDDTDWVESAGVSNVRLNQNSYKYGGSSVSFGSNGSSATLSLYTTFDSKDLSSYENDGVIFGWFKLPSSLPTSISVKIGSDSSNYSSKSATVKQSGLPFSEGWNLVAFDLGSSSDTGTPDFSAITFVEITITNSEALTVEGYGIDYIFCGLGDEVSIDYYSKYLVLDNDGKTRKEVFENGDDKLILAEKESGIVIKQCVQTAQENLREDQKALITEKAKKDDLENLKLEYPSQDELTSISYYNL